MSSMKFTEEKLQHFYRACALLLPACTCESIPGFLLCEPVLPSNHKLFPSKFSDDHVNDTFLYHNRNQSYSFYPELKHKHVKNHKLFTSKFSDDHVNDTYLDQNRNQSYSFYPELKGNHVNDTHHHSFRIVVR